MKSKIASLDQALEAFTQALASNAGSLELAAAKADLDAAYRTHVTSLHLGEALAVGA